MLVRDPDDAARPRCHDGTVTDADQRMPWHDVPGHVRAAVEDLLGSPVLTASSQRGGFSPGSADRVTTADGGRAFVKTAWSRINERSAEIHRREASVVAALPPGMPAPRLIGVVDHGEWVAIVLEDVEARQPTTPWRTDELDAVLDALATIAETPLPAATALPALEDEMARLFSGWSRLGDIADLALDAPLAAWVEAHRTDFVDASARALRDLRGDRLVHQDVRADNILIRPDGHVVVVDWPWAAQGAGWFDALSLLINVRLFDPNHDVEKAIRGHRVFGDMPQDAATRALVGFAGFFLEASTQPPSPGIPTLRSFQRVQGIATVEWLRERMPGLGHDRGVTPTG
jgi:Phosphotransferase enzyme family